MSAAFDSMDHSIEVFSGSAKDLWSVFGEKAGFSGAEKIKNAALNMERRLDEQLAIKKQYTDANLKHQTALSVAYGAGLRQRGGVAKGQ